MRPLSALRLLLLPVVASQSGGAEDEPPAPTPGPTAAPKGYECATDWLMPTDVPEVARKGICLDDTTFADCAEKIPVTWPNTASPIKSLRMFKAWDDLIDQPDENRHAVHDAVAGWAHATGSKVLLGTEISCDKDANERKWGWTKELLVKLGPDHVMGVSLGNEMDLYELKDHGAFNITIECINEFWGYHQPDMGVRSSYLYRLFDDWTRELDALPGFSQAAAEGKLVPVTTILSGLSMASDSGDPFLNGMPGPWFDSGALGHVMVYNLLKNLTQKFGRRYVFALNIYPYFDDGGNTLDPGCYDRCRSTVFSDLCFSNATDKWGNLRCKFVGTAARFRGLLQSMTGNRDDPFWVTEFGWSYPVATTLKKPMSECQDFVSREALVTAYQGFLQWDVQLPGGLEPPSHIFYFTVRDSKNFGERESFGLVGSCEDSTCKLQCDDKEGGCPTPYCWATPESLGDIDCQPRPSCQWPDWAVPIWNNLRVVLMITTCVLAVLVVFILLCCLCVRPAVRKRQEGYVRMGA